MAAADEDEAGAFEHYPPIAEHGIIGDMHRRAGRHRRHIDWLCAPSFDSPSVFGAILDRRRGGFWRIAPADGEWTSKQLYLPETDVLITRFLTADGVAEITDFMPIRPDHAPRAVVRRVSSVRGDVALTTRIEPRFDYGRVNHGTSCTDGGAVRSRLEELLVREDGPVFVCGIAANIDQIIGLFDAVFLLHIDETTQEARLVKHDTANPPGRSEAGRKEIREGRATFEAQMASLGAVVLDGTVPTPVVADELLTFVG